MANENIESTENIQRAMQEVYSACDTNNINSVPASTLFNFFVTLFEFNQLKKTLDPDNTNGNITCETFITIVLKWFESCELLKPRPINQEGSPQQSSINTTSESYESIKDLQHKNQKLHDEVELVKTQLVSYDERNEELQIEIERKSQKLFELENINSELQLLKEKNLERAQTSNHQEKEIHRLRKSLDTANKCIDQLNAEANSLKIEKKNLQDRLNILQAQRDAEISVVNQLNIKLVEKDNEITCLSDRNFELKNTLSEQQDRIIHYTSYNERLKEIVKRFGNVIQDREFRFSILKMSFGPIISSPGPGRRTLSKVLDFNNPLTQNSEAFVPVSNITGDDLELIDSSLEMDNCLSTMNEVLCSNNNEVSFSLHDEMLLAEQEYHKSECDRTIRLQKSQIEELNFMLKTTSEIEEKLKNDVNELNTRITEEVIKSSILKVDNEQLFEANKMLQKEIALFRGKEKDFHVFELDVNSNVDQFEPLFALQNPNYSNTDLYLKVIEALQNDSKTIDSRFIYQKTNYKSCQNQLFDEFIKLEIHLGDSIQHLKEICQNTCEMAVAYGSLYREKCYLKYIDFLITYSSCSSEKTATPKRKICSFYCVLFIVFFLVFSLELLFRFNNSFFSMYIKKSYYDVPPPT